MKESILFALLFFGMIHFAQSQDVYLDSSNKGFKYGNSIQFEIGGPGAVYSVNYERNIINTKYYKVSQQIGLSLYPSSFDFAATIWIPYSINQLFSLNQHHLETGVGLVVTNDNVENGDQGLDKYFYIYYTAKIGYRYQKPNGRMTYKFLFTPLWERQYNWTYFHPWGAFSIGYNF